MSRDDMAKVAGLRSFDTALPQDWVDSFRDKTPIYAPSLNIVWCYDVARTFGAPFALDVAAAEFLLKFDSNIEEGRNFSFYTAHQMGMHANGCNTQHA